MSKTPYKFPKYKETSFNCPHCQAFAEMSWDLPTFNRTIMRGFSITCCSHCGNYQIWVDKKLVYPKQTNIVPPNNDMPKKIKEDYLEAASILQNSPRGAAALLRLAIQKLCKEFGGEGKNINSDIKKLVEEGLPSSVQKSLDAVRVIGNESVHPGMIDMRDDIGTAKALFKLVNLITEKMITEPKEVEDIYNKIPESKKKQIESRDNNNK